MKMTLNWTGWIHGEPVRLGLSPSTEQAADYKEPSAAASTP